MSVLSFSRNSVTQKMREYGQYTHSSMAIKYTLKADLVHSNMFWVLLLTFQNMKIIFFIDEAKHTSDQGKDPFILYCCNVTDKSNISYRTSTQRTSIHFFTVPQCCSWYGDDCSKHGNWPQRNMQWTMNGP